MPQHLKSKCGTTCVILLFFYIEIYFTLVENSPKPKKGIQKRVFMATMGKILSPSKILAFPLGRIMEGKLTVTQFRSIVLTKIMG